MSQAHKLLINGQLVEGADTLDVINPATGAIFVTVARANADQADQAVAAAKAAQPGWAALDLSERASYLNKLADAIDANADALTRALVQEQGKPMAEAGGEVAFTAIFIRHFAGFNGFDREIMQDDDALRIEARYTPLGVVAGITPWNFPLLLGVAKIAPALVTGNTFVLKPAPTTPVTSLMVGEMAADILPAGVLNIVTDANDLGPALTDHPDVAKVSFTGSTATGKKVMAAAASSLKRITLELGGNDAAILLDDIDVKAAAPKVFGGAFTNAGQVCIAVKRLYVHESQYDAMCEELAKIADETVQGDGLEQGTTIGPLQNAQQFEKAKGFLEAAKRDGTVIAGGDVAEDGGYFIRPTIVKDVPDDSPIVNEEQFAPILPVLKYNDVDDVLARANDTEYGLGGSVWSSNVDRAIELAEKVDSGTVWVNHHLHFGPHVPFAGAKQSGLGVEFSEEGLREFMQRRVISVSKA
ncbi:MAG: aldehyde dehydrogenase family protein [Alphaproteobacteria bacterium]